MSLQGRLSAGFASHAHPESELRRKLGSFSATCVVLGELAVIIGAFLDPKYRRGAVIGGVWVLAAIACYAIFFRRPHRRSGSLQVST